MAFHHSEPKYHTGPGKNHLPDLGWAHIAAWHRELRRDIYASLNAEIAQLIASGHFSKRPSIKPIRARSDDVQGDYEPSGIDGITNAEAGA